jgi:ATP-binding cassette subfamily A (ABC1) protein 3
VEERRHIKCTFGVPNGTRLSQVFEFLEANRATLGITDYSVTQSSLEQVFLRISASAEQEADLVTASPQPVVPPPRVPS